MEPWNRNQVYTTTISSYILSVYHELIQLVTYTAGATVGSEARGCFRIIEGVLKLR